MPASSSAAQEFDLVVVGGGPGGDPAWVKRKARVVKTVEEIADTMHAHARPTLGESTMEAAMVALGLPVHTAPAGEARAGRR